VYEASLDRVAIVSAATLMVYLIGTVIFLFWFHRAYANLPSLGATAIRHGTGWAVGGWFVPFLNFVRPKQIADQTWKGSYPDQLDGPPDVDGGSVPAFVDLWWFFWVVGTIGSWVYARMPEGRSSRSSPRSRCSRPPACSTCSRASSPSSWSAGSRRARRSEPGACSSGLTPPNFRCACARCTPSATAATRAR
jgi:hypothetical protein